MPVIVVLDTNILTVPAQFNIDIFAETERILERRIEFIVLTPVVQELKKKLEKATKTERFKFKVALDFTKRCTIIEEFESSTTKSVDDQVLEYAQSVHGVIATNDKALRERALHQGVPVIFMRGKKRLELLGTVR